jgi:Tol biopolymer transport system component
VANALYAIAGGSFGNLSPSEIVIYHLADGHLTTVTDSLSLNHSPAWSPDGRWLYFVSNRDGPSDVYGVTPDQPGAVVRLSTGLDAHTISLAADGSRLAYSRYSIRNSVSSLPIPTRPPMTASVATRITNTNEVIESVALSPDGQWLLYDSDLTGNAEIFRVPTAGGEPVQLTNDPADDFAAAASPNGNEIAWHSWRSGSRDIYVMRLDGGGVQRVTSSSRQEAIPDWSPDGNALVFADFTTGEGIWIVRRNAAGAWGEPIQRREGGTGPVWSPDGRSIAFATGSANGSLKVMPAEGGPERLLVDATRPGAPAVEKLIWAKDGRIYFVTHGSGGEQAIWSVPAAGGPARLEVRFAEELHPSYLGGFALGGGRFYFTTEDRDSDVWVLEILNGRLR